MGNFQLAFSMTLELTSVSELPSRGTSYTVHHQPQENIQRKSSCHSDGRGEGVLTVEATLSWSMAELLQRWSCSWLALSLMVKPSELR